MTPSIQAAVASDPCGLVVPSVPQDGLHRLPEKMAANNEWPAQYRIFIGLKKMIALHKETPVFAGFDNRRLLAVDNPNLLVFSSRAT